METAQSRIKMTIDLDAPGRHAGDLMLRWSDNANPLGYYPVPIISIKGGNGPIVLIIGARMAMNSKGPPRSCAWHNTCRQRRCKVTSSCFPP